MHCASAASLALAFLLVSPAHATDTLAPGFHTDSTHPFGIYDTYATLASGDRVTFDGSVVALETDAGSPIGTLYVLPSSVFGSFLLVDPSQSYVLLGESSHGIIYRIDLHGAGGAPLTQLDFNYDAVFEDAQHVIVSAATVCFGCGNQIYRVDVSSGIATQIADVLGFSGPLDVASNGDLYYCTQDPNFPPAPGSSSIVRWTSAQTHAGQVLTDTDATVFVGNLDGGASMRFEHVFHHLFLCETPFSSADKILEFDTAGNRVDEIVTTTNTLSSLEFLYGGGAGSFQAFQPAGVTLKYRSSDYSLGTSDILTVRPRRAVASTSGPGLTGPGNVTFLVTGAYPGASYFILAGPAASYVPVETGYDLHSYLFFTGIPFNQIRRTGINVTTDASGTGSFTYFNPGTLQGTRVLQALLRNPGGVFVGSSTAAFN